MERTIFEKLKSRDEIKKDFIDSFYLAIKKDLDLVRYVFEELKKSHPNSQLEIAKLDEIINFDVNKEFKDIEEKYRLILEKNYQIMLIS